jgi:predicted porin
MKKTLIAVAALAATGAFAQVSVYGRLDVGYAVTTTTATTAGVGVDTKANGLQSHNEYSSMWGIKGVEDLGGGMKASFQLEQDVYTPNGNVGVSGASGGVGVTSGVLSTSSTVQTQISFDRVSRVNLEGGFGTVGLGRDYNVVFKLIGATDVMNLSRMSTVQQSANIGGSTMPNLIHYASPNLGGFTLNANYGNDDRSNATADKNVTTALTAVYSNGPLMVGIGAGSNEITAAAVVTKTEGTALGASYDFKVVKVVGNYITKKATAAASDLENKEMNLGVLVPMGKITLMAQIGNNTNKQSLPSTTDTSGNDYVIGVDYALSARTSVFLKNGIYNKSSGTLLNDATADTKQTSTAIGIKTVF